jgi:hypothetical protein
MQEEDSCTIAVCDSSGVAYAAFLRACLEGVGLRPYVLVAEVHRSDLDAVRHALCACHARAVGAAIERAVRLDAVPDHLDAAILAVGREGMYRAFEAVESVRVSTGHTYLKGLVILISTDLALSHLYSPFPQLGDSEVLK